MKTFNVINAYAPQVGLEDRIMKPIWKEMDRLMQIIPKREIMIIGCNLNGHEEKNNIEYARMHDYLVDRRIVPVAAKAPSPEAPMGSKISSIPPVGRGLSSS